MNYSSVSLERNLRLYGWVKVFTMRAYLPITSIYLVEVGQLTLAQIGILATIAAVTTLASTIPTGYFADRVTRKAALLVGAALMGFATLLYVIVPNFAGAIAATILVQLGFSFLSGAGEALIHDTLVEVGRPDSYVRVLGRAQSFGLTGNIVLVGLVPLTYAIDKRLPFLISTIASALFVWVVSRMVEPHREVTDRHHNPAVDLIRSLRRFMSRHSLMLFMAIGMVSGLYLSFAFYNTLIFQDLGMPASLLGLMFAAASCVAAVGGWYVHHLRKISLPSYAALDVVISCGFLLAVGLSHNLWLSILAFLINMGFWRFRKIIYQDHLLKRFPGVTDKATLISTLGFFESLNAVWMPFGFVLATTTYGYYFGYTVLGLVAAMLFTAAFAIGFAALRRAPSTA
jgi:MFS family permease